MIDKRWVSLIIHFIINLIIRHSLTIKKPMGESGIKSSNYTKYYRLTRYFNKTKRNQTDNWRIQFYYS